MLSVEPKRFGRRKMVLQRNKFKSVHAGAEAGKALLSVAACSKRKRPSQPRPFQKIAWCEEPT